MPPALRDCLHTIPPFLARSTPDMATPGEAQHFLVDYESNAQMGLEDESSRSPAPSPRRHIKRPRPILGK